MTNTNVTNSIEVKDLTLNFGAVSVLKKMNLDVAEGEFIVLLGPSGCGKSTLAELSGGAVGHHRWADLHQGQERDLGRAVASAASAWCSSPMRFTRR